MEFTRCSRTRLCAWCHKSSQQGIEELRDKRRRVRRTVERGHDEHVAHVIVNQVHAARGADLLWELAKKDFLYNLHFRIEPGLWFCDRNHRFPGLGVFERYHLSLWRIFKRFLLSIETAATANAGRMMSLGYIGWKYQRSRDLPQVAERHTPHPMDTLWKSSL